MKSTGREHWFKAPGKILMGFIGLILLIWSTSGAAEDKAVPGGVRFEKGKLTIQASNTRLIEILVEIQKSVLKILE